MNNRIGLFTQTSAHEKTKRTTTTSYVDVASAQDLVKKLVELGAKKVGLLRRDRTGTTHLEGEMLAPSALTEKHMEWLTAKPEAFETRGVFYSTV